MNKNFGLTESEFNQLLEALQAGDDRLFEQVFLAHFQDCMHYLMRTYKASHENAYDVTMDTLLVFRKRLQAGKVGYGNLRFLFTQMAGQHYRRWIKKENLTEELVAIEIAELPNFQFEPSDMQLFDRAWVQLGSSCKELLKRFYYDGVSLNEIAQQSAKNAAAIRKQKQRCVEKLRALFLKLDLDWY